jgi:hypothetical protein
LLFQTTAYGQVYRLLKNHPMQTQKIPVGAPKLRSIHSSTQTIANHPLVNEDNTAFQYQSFSDQQMHNLLTI